MIISGFLYTASYLLNWFIELFALSSGYPASVFTTVDSLGQFLWSWDFLVPIDSIFDCLYLVLITQALIYGFKSTKWLISHIPWIGGKG